MLLKKKCSKVTPTIYRYQALYLQKIREKLVKEVKKAILYLITESKNSNFKEINNKLQDNLQLKINNIVSSSLSLLTIEQLVDLSNQIENEKKLAKQRTKEELLLALRTEQNSSVSKNASVTLSFDPPIEDTSYLESWDLKCRGTSFDVEPDRTSGDTYQEEVLTNTNIEPSKNLLIGEKIDNLNMNQIDFLDSLFVFTGESLKKDSEHEEVPRLSKPENPLLDDNSQNETSFLPRTPLELAKWLDSFEIALERRLRDLSHELNLELLKFGIINSLLPVNLLEAVIVGQIETQSSISNILSVQIPMQTQFLEGGMEIACLLLRPADFEFDYTDIRLCRTTLRKNRTEVFKMVRQQKHWERRSLANNLHRKWSDSNSSE